MPRKSAFACRRHRRRSAACRLRSARWFPAVHVSVLVRVEDYMEARSRDDDRDDDVLQWAHVHG